MMAILPLNLKRKMCSFELFRRPVRWPDHGPGLPGTVRLACGFWLAAMMAGAPAHGHGQAAAGSTAAGDAREGGGPVIVAHRGAMSERPENTMAAFGRAVELGAGVVEVDVRSTRDGRLVVLHDATVDRTTDGHGRVSELELADVRALDAGSWFDEAFAGERVPTLEQVLRWGAGRVDVLLDLKQSDPRFVAAVVAAVEAHGDRDRVIVGVRSPEQAREFRRRLPDCRQLAFMASAELIEAFDQAGCDVLRLWLRWLEEDDQPLRRVRATGRKLMINGTVGGLDEARALLGHRPEWILIDDVQQLRESLARLAGEAP